MGPIINNDSYQVSSQFNDRLNISPLHNAKNQTKSRIKKPLLFTILAVFFILIIVATLLISKKTATRNIEDLMSFMKLYQYGEVTEKKNINVSIAPNYTYAYRVALGTISSDQKKQYADKLYSSYLKYDDNMELIDILFYYKTLLSLSDQLPFVKQNYLEGGENSARDLISKYTRDFKDVKTENIKNKLQSVSDYYMSNLNFFIQANVLGCISNKSISTLCLDQLSISSSENSEYFKFANEISAFDSNFDQAISDTVTDMDKIIMDLYREKIINKGNKNEK